MDLEKINKELYYIGHPDMINGTKILINVIKEMNIEIEKLKAINFSSCCESDSELLCECGGNERIALDCTIKPCKHPKYSNKQA